MTEINEPLLRKGVEWVEYQATLPMIDREWLQDYYVTPPERKAHALSLHARADAIDQGRSELGTMEEVFALRAQLEPYCGTAYCVAGYIGQLLEERYARHEVVNGMQVADFAERELGLTAEQADLLFAGSNTAERIRYLAEEFVGHPL